MNRSGALAGWLTAPLIQRERQACYKRFKSRVEAPALQTVTSVVSGR